MPTSRSKRPIVAGKAPLIVRNRRGSAQPDRATGAAACALPVRRGHGRGGEMTEAEGVAAAVEDEAYRLCQEILRISGGVPEVTFGELARDDNVTNTFEALLGTLKAARRRGLLTFTGELLLMGQHDDIPIRLAAAGVEGQPASPTKPPAAAAAAAEGTAAADADGSEQPTAAEEIAAKARLNSTEDLTVAAAAAPASPTAAAASAAPASPAAAAEEVNTSSPTPAAADTAASPGRPSGGSASGVSPSHEGDADSEGKKWKVDMTYIDHRTADPDRLEGRRASSVGDIAAPGAVGSGPLAQVKKEDGKWSQVDVSYINHRTSVVENLEGRKTVGGAEGNTVSASATTKKESDGKWKVDTSYINHRTDQVENLDGHQTSSVDASTMSALSSATTKKESDGKWKVDTSYINHRTAECENLEARKETLASSTVPETPPVAAPAPSSTVKKDTDGTWKVDTSYIGHRTADTANLTRKEEKTDSENYADPTQAKYPYAELKGVGQRPNDVDPKCKELYLTEEEFQTIFGLSIAEFGKLPKWKQQNLKKAKDVF